MPTLPEEIDAAPWHRMFHAYAVATDTPNHLKALATDDAEAHKAALTHLFSAEIHQGTPWPSTPTTAVFVARLLADGLIRDPGLRVDLLRFLRAVAESGDLGGRADEARAAAYPEDDRAVNDWLDRYLAADEEGRLGLWTDEAEVGELLAVRAVVDCHDAMPRLLELVLPLAGAPEPDVRTAALSAAVVLARHPRADAQRSRLIETLAEAAREPGLPADDRAALVLCIGETGAAPREFLADPWLVVRGCAALAPALAADPEALGVLAELIASPRAFELGFTRRPDQFGTSPRCSLIAAACARLPDDDRLIAGVASVEPGDGWFSAEDEIGPYLRRFFAAGWPVPAERGRGQRSLARLIARADGLWNPGDGNRYLAFARLSLPQGREAWRELADAPAEPGRYSAADIEVLSSAMALRRRPERYFGTAGTNRPRSEAIVDLLDRAYQQAVDEGRVGAFSIDISTAPSSPSADRCFTLRVAGHELSSEPGESARPAPLTSVMTACFAGPQPLKQVTMTAAVCAKATATAYRDGRAFTQNFAVATPLGPITVSEPESDAPADGYAIAFELDRTLL